MRPVPDWSMIARARRVEAARPRGNASGDAQHRAIAYRASYSSAAVMSPASSNG
jgi:hypothetical protein